MVQWYRLHSYIVILLSLMLSFSFFVNVSVFIFPLFYFSSLLSLLLFCKTNFLLLSSSVTRLSLFASLSLVYPFSFSSHSVFHFFSFSLFFVVLPSLSFSRVPLCINFTCSLFPSLFLLFFQPHFLNLSLNFYSLFLSFIFVPHPSFILLLYSLNFIFVLLSSFAALLYPLTIITLL